MTILTQSGIGTNKGKKTFSMVSKEGESHVFKGKNWKASKDLPARG